MSIPDTSPTSSPQTMARMFGRIARWYDPLNRIFSLGFDQRWRKRLAREALAPCGTTSASALPRRVADLAAGTLDVALAVRRLNPDTTVIALDLCPAMLEQGQRKLARHTPHFRHGLWLSAADATRLPLPDACVDRVTMAFGIRNIPQRAAAFAEMLRVLTPGGKACILEFGSGQNRTWLGLYNFYLEHVLPRLGSCFSGDPAYAYLASSIQTFPVASELANELRLAGFANVRYTALTSGIVYLHMGEKPVEHGQGTRL